MAQPLMAHSPWLAKTMIIMVLCIIHPGWLELPLARTIFHGPKSVWAIGVIVYTTLKMWRQGPSIYSLSYLTWLLLWIFYVFVLSCVCYVLCASVYMCFVVTCWERADLLALVYGVFCEFVTFPLVSWVRCGTWLYRFLIFAILLTLSLWLRWAKNVTKIRS